MSTAILPDIVAEAERILAGAREQNVLVRLIGGLAIRIHADGGLPPPLERPYRDIDVVTTGKHARGAGRLLQELGYVANERFNAMNAGRRMVFYDVPNERQLDVFVNEFRMCHQIPIAARLDRDPRTIPLAELLLTKLQIVQLNRKDLCDTWALVYAHDVADHDDDAINADFIARILAGDWGLWRTSRGTVETARQLLPESGLGDADRLMIDERLDRLWQRVEAEPKSLRWRGRARVGERTRWYEEPEEIAHGHPAGE